MILMEEIFYTYYTSHFEKKTKKNQQDLNFVRFFFYIPLIDT